MRSQYFLMPVAVAGIVGGVLAGIPGCCYGCFLWGAGAGFLSVLWGKGRGATWSGLGEPTLVGLFTGLAGSVIAVILCPLLIYLFGPMVIRYFEGQGRPAVAVPMPDNSAESNAPDETNPPPFAPRPGSSQAPPPEVLAIMGLVWGAMSGAVYLCFATLGGLLGGVIFSQKDIVPPLDKAPPPPLAPA